MSEAMKLDGLARPNFGAVSRNHHAKANANEDAAQQGRVSEINERRYKWREPEQDEAR
ncbi:MAG: hypothetical protein WBG18_03795 [Xanthobacteraceae bacterium]|jgi:hypothetical protein